MKVFTNGCFDLIHVGHINLLNYCRWLADNGENPFIVSEEYAVIVGLDMDEKIMKDKGSKRPYFNFQERSRQLMALRGREGDPIIDTIYSFRTNEELYEIIKSVKPDIIVKGQHWEGNVVGSDLGAETRYYQIHEGYSSTEIEKRVSKKAIEEHIKIYGCK